MLQRLLKSGSGLSLKYRIALTVFLLEAVMITVMLWQTSTVSLNGTEKYLEQADETVIALLMPYASTALDTRNCTYFNPPLVFLRGDKRIIAVYLVDRNGLVVSASDQAQMGTRMPDMLPTPVSYWRSRPVMLGEHRAGSLNMHISKEALVHAAANARHRAITVAVMGMSVIALAGMLIGFLLTRRLERLAAASERLAAGEQGVKVGFGGENELARLGRSFDRMAETIGAQLDALKSSEERNRVLVEHGPAAIFVFDADAFCLTDVNQKFADMLKYSREQMIGMTPLQVSPPLQKAGRPTDEWALELVGRTLAGERPTAPWMLRDSTGNDIPCELQLTRYPSAERNLMIGIIYEVSERERITQALSRRVEFEDLIVKLSTRFIGLKQDEIDRGINEALGEIGRFAGVDRSYVFQFSDDLGSESCTHEWCGTGIDPAITRLQNLPLASYPWFMGRIGHGEILHVPRVRDLPPAASREREEFEAESIQSVVMVPLAFEGRVIGYMGFDSVRGEKEWAPEIVMLLKIAGEITFNALHRKRAEQALHMQAQELEKTNSALARSNEELKQFAYIASHDLQEPLRAISGFSALLAREYADKLGQDANEYIRFITGSAGRMHSMIIDLLNYSRIDTQAGDFALCSVKEAYGLAKSNLLVAKEESGAEISCGELPDVMADKSQLTQLLQNLLGNAIKFRGSSPPQIRVDARSGVGEWIFSVADNGIGLAPQHIEQIFHIFKRLHTREQYEGTGIGLAVCKRIVERHGGRIWVESAPGKGSTFCFTIPGPA